MNIELSKEGRQSLHKEYRDLERYFHPKAEIVTQLPDPRAVKDLVSVLLDNLDDTYTEYRMIKGSWKQGSTFT